MQSDKEMERPCLSMTYHVCQRRARQCNGCCVLQRVLCTATGVVYCNGCCVVQRVLCTATGVVYYNGCCVVQRVLCSATGVV